jgi:hypothetical protein
MFVSQVRHVVDEVESCEPVQATQGLTFHLIVDGVLGA